VYCSAEHSAGAVEQSSVTMRIVGVVCGSWAATARTAVLLGVVGVGVWLLPMDFEVGPVHITHLPRCEVQTEMPNQVPMPDRTIPAAN
jgi:hypothetical protein